MNSIGALLSILLMLVVGRRSPMPSAPVVVAPIPAVCDTVYTFNGELATLATDEELVQSVKDCKSAKIADPKNARHPWQLGRIYSIQYTLALMTKYSDVQKAKTTYRYLLLQSKTELLLSIALDPKFGVAHFDLSNVYDRLDEVENAIKEMKIAAELSPRDVGVYFQLGLLSYRNGDKADAKRNFEYAIVLSPNYTGAMWYLAAIYEEEGDYQSALKLIEKVQQLNPTDELVKVRVERLKAKIK